MHETIKDVDGCPLNVIVNDEVGGVQIEGDSETGCAYMTFTTSKARALAAALLHAADEAEGK